MCLYVNNDFWDIIYMIVIIIIILRHSEDIFKNLIIPIILALKSLLSLHSLTLKKIHAKR